MFKKIILILALVLVALSVYVALQPSHFTISREITINAPAAKIFPLINSSRLANDWMPWAESDPQAQMEYFGPDSGVGSGSRWDSPGTMGTGEAVVVRSIDGEVVDTQLKYTKPMTMEQLASVSLTPGEAGTIVRWSVSGDSNFFGRFICLFMNMEKVVGSEFDKGLAKLKLKVESAG